LIALNTDSEIVQAAYPFGFATVAYRIGKLETYSGRKQRRRLTKQSRIEWSVEEVAGQLQTGRATIWEDVYQLGRLSE